MADVKIRKLPEWVVATHKARAGRAGRSLEGQLRALLTEAAAKPQTECADRIVALSERLKRKYGTLSDSAVQIREDRGARG